MAARFLGIDVGGTNTKLVVLGDVGGEPEVLSSSSVETGAADGPDVALARLAAAAREVLDAHGPVQAASATVPGLFDQGSGAIVLLPNFPQSWQRAGFGAGLSSGLGVPVTLINDARAFTLAETRLGAARDCSTVVCVVLGTGVGGGVVVDGALRFGPDGRAGELGHQVVELDGAPCGCGNRGCVEAYVAAAALAHAGGQATAEEVFAAAASGDERAAAAVTSFVRHLAAGLGNAVTVLWPDCVVVGGGVAAAGDALFGPLRTALAEAAPLVDPASYRVVPAQLGPYAGAVGAALWAQGGPART